MPMPAMELCHDGSVEDVEGYEEVNCTVPLVVMRIPFWEVRLHR